MHANTYGEGTLLSVWLQPRASRTRIVGIHGDSVKISVQAPPLEGRANDECIEYLSAILGFPKKYFTIKSGQQSRYKKIYIEGMTPEVVVTALQRAMGST